METVNCPCRLCKIYLHSVGFYRKETLNVKKKKIQQISKFCVVFCFNFLCSTVLVVQLETRQVRFVLQINRLISIWFPVIQDT